MIIKEVRIKNFRSYYGDNNHFEFSDGLTLILGDNGDGKTTFFEALQWLLDTTIDRGSMDNVSEMRKSKLEIGESDEVSVYMLFEHDGEKSVEKSFTFERTGNDTYKPSNLTYRGYETRGTEREAVNGKQLIDRCYDAFIQHFSMFKGESELDVLDNPTALKDLVDKFSDIRKFDVLVENTTTFEEKSNAAYSKEMKSDEKVSKEAKALDFQKTRLAEQISQKNGDRPAEGQVHRHRQHRRRHRAGALLHDGGPSGTAGDRQDRSEARGRDPEGGKCLHQVPHPQPGRGPQCFLQRPCGRDRLPRGYRRQRTDGVYLRPFRPG